MKILYMLHNDPRAPGGTEKYTLQLAAAVADGNNEVSILYPVVTKEDIEPRMETSQSGNIRFYALHRKVRNGFLPPGQDEKRLNELLQSVLAETKPDVIHIQHLMNLPHASLPAAALSGARTVMTLNDFGVFCMRNHLERRGGEFCAGSGGGNNCAVHCLPRARRASAILSHYIGAVEGGSAETRAVAATIRNRQSVFPRLDRVTAPSQYVLDRYREEGFEAPSATVLEPGIVPFDAPPPRKPARPIRFAAHGNINRGKGADLLIDAFRKIRPADATLTFHGRIVEKESESLLSKAASKFPNICYAGPFDEQDLPIILGEADCVINATRLPESFSLVVSEAWMAGRPVVAGRTGALASRITPGAGGLLFEPGDSASLLEQLKSIIDRPEILDELRSGIPEVTTVEKHLAEILKIYRGE